MPPKPVNQGRRVTIDPVATAKATSKKKTKGRSTEPVKAGHRSKPKVDEEDVEDDDEDEDGEDDVLDGSQETESIMRMFSEKLSKRSNKPSTKFLELEQSVKEMFQEARQSSLERRQVCEKLLANVVSGINEVQQSDVEPDTSQITSLLGTRTRFATRVATGHEGAIEPIDAEVKAATQEVDDNLGQHAELRAQSRKRLGKYARGEFQRGLVAQEFATDANAYIRHYKKLLLI